MRRRPAKRVAIRRAIALAMAVSAFCTVSGPAAANWASSGSGAATARADAIVAPTGLSATCNLLLGRSVSLQWSAANTWAGYEVRWGTSSGGPYGSSATTTGTTYTTPALSSGTTYYFVVRAVKGPWLSSNSNQVSRTIGLLTCL